MGGGEGPRVSTDSPRPILYPTFKSVISTRMNFYFHSIRIILCNFQFRKEKALVFSEFVSQATSAHLYIKIMAVLFKIR